MRRLFILAMIWLLCFSSLPTSAQDTAGCEVALEQLAETLYLDTTRVPDGLDHSTLIRLYDFLETQVIPDRCSPFLEYVRKLPVIVRYVPFSEDGQFPFTTQGYAGWCDLVYVDCAAPLEGHCFVSISQQHGSPPTRVFLVLVALPDANAPDYSIQLWGITAHEIAHTLGAIDGPRYPFYEDDKRLAPVECVSDTYYWFGMAQVFEPGWQGLIRDAWQNTCAVSLCDALRQDVFQLN